MIFVASVQNTGTHFIWEVLGGEPFRKRFLSYGGNDIGGPVTGTHFWPEYMGLIEELSVKHKTVVPLRHPVAVAISWKKRGRDGFYDGWRLMSEANLFDPFFFPLETQPYEELEAYLGRTVNRVDRVVGAHQAYDEKLWWERGLVAGVKKFLREYWDQAQELLQTDPIAKRFYS